MFHCQICNFKISQPKENTTGVARGNTQKYKNKNFNLWQCPNCSSIHNTDDINFNEMYTEYPLNNRTIDIFSKGTMGNLLKRLKKAGLKKTHKILDFGTGNGVFIKYLKQKGYKDITGYDPYFPEFATPPSNDDRFDFIINNDTLEHCSNIQQMMKECKAWLKPNGILYIGTPETDNVNIKETDKSLTTLHQPFHRIITNEGGLKLLASKFDFKVIKTYKRSYHDTLRPFSNFRFLDELLIATDHNIDIAMDPDSSNRVFLKNPKLWFYALFGYFIPSAYEPAIILLNSKK